MKKNNIKSILSILLISISSASFSQIINTIAGNGTAGYSGDGGPATAAELNVAYGVALDGSKNIYIADWKNNRVRKVDVSGIITTIAGNGTAGYMGDGGPATAAELNDPSGVTVDSHGNVYIADALNNCIRKVNTFGIITTIAGNGTAGYSGDGGPATAAELNDPYDMVVDASGNIYISDNINNRIRIVNTSGIINTFAGTGGPHYSGDGGPATAAEIYVPWGITLDKTGNLYISDYGNFCIRKVNTSGIISTVAGIGGTFGFSGDGGPATAAELWSASGISVDSLGNLFIADRNDRRIRMVNTSGLINTVAGNGVDGYSGDGGAPLNAEMTPMGVVANSNSCGGEIYIADGYNNCIRKIIPISYNLLCWVTVDSLSAHNLISWDTTGTNGEPIDSVILYFLNASNAWQKIGAESFNEPNRYFVDNTSNPNAVTVRYCLKTTDRCGDSSWFSNWQNTMYISNIGGGTFSWSGTGYLIQNNALPVLTYYLFRNDSIVDSVSGTQNKITDVNYSPLADYFVGAKLSVPICDLPPGAMSHRAELNSNSASLSHSNVIKGTTGINAINSNIYSINIYPEPNAGYFNVSGIIQGQQIELYNYIGQKLSSTIADNSTMHFDISSNANGIYLMRILNKDGSVVALKKVLKTQ